MEVDTLSRLITDAPLYLPAEVDQFMQLPRATTSRWSTGLDCAGLITRFEVEGRKSSIPFIGMAEAFMISAIRKAGVPMQRIRPAVQALKTELGVEHVLVSRDLYTDGAEVLYDYGKREGLPQIAGLVVARNGQLVIGPVVESFMQRITFTEGSHLPCRIMLPRYQSRGGQVALDPSINFGQPILVDYGVAVSHILGLVQAGETYQSVAEEYGIPREVIEQTVFAA